MANPVITNFDGLKLPVFNPIHRDDVFTAAGAATILVGTLLARLTATLKLVVFVKGGAGGAEIPVAILSEEIVATGAGDHNVRPLIGGQVAFDKLVIAADGDNSNIDNAVLDQLRDFTIVSVPGRRVDEYDNA